MFVNVFSVSFWLSICVLSAQCLLGLEEGEQCTSDSDGTVGICVSPRRCLSSVQDIKTKNFPEMCSFKGQDPIICCTDCELINDTSNVLVDEFGWHNFKIGQKSKDKCLEYQMTLPLVCLANYGLRKVLSKEKKCYEYKEADARAAIGGVNAYRRQFPHMALLGYGDSLDSAQCLSSVTGSYILTAAHCVTTDSIGTVKYVALGILKRTDPSELWQRYTVRRAIRHPQYNPPSKYNDIALLEVETKIEFSKDVLPACLDPGSYDISYGTATGWGALGHHRTLADTLQVVDLLQFTDEECAAAYPPHRLLVNGYNRSTQLCYGDKKKIIDTCEGDSGGPFQVPSRRGDCMSVIAGVTSYGRSCGILGAAGMYTRVSHYIPWIESIVWPKFVYKNLLALNYFRFFFYYSAK